MKKIFEWIGGFALIAFSFYFTDQVSLLVASKSELMQEIQAVSQEYEEVAVDAVINDDDNTIVPGKYGKKVDEKESYLSMHEFGAFNENYLIYTQIKPKVSLEDNKDKIITGGNKSKRSISLIIDNNESVSNYLDSQKIKYNYIAQSIDDLKSDVKNFINGASNKDDFKSINSKDSNGSKICIDSYSDRRECIKYNYYIVKPEVTLNSINIGEVKNALSSGSIVLITSTAKVEHVRLLLSDINYKDLKTVYISDLISER